MNEEEDIAEAVEEAMEKVASLGDNTNMTQEWSVQFYQAVAAECSMRAETIQGEME